jgi:hypothetical protein
MLLDPKSGEPTRTKTVVTTTDGDHTEQRRTKERVSVKSGQAIPRVR